MASGKWSHLTDEVQSARLIDRYPSTLGSTRARRIDQRTQARCSIYDNEQSAADFRDELIDVGLVVRVANDLLQSHRQTL